MHYVETGMFSKVCCIFPAGVMNLYIYFQVWKLWQIVFSRAIDTAINWNNYSAKKRQLLKVWYSPMNLILWTLCVFGVGVHTAGEVRRPEAMKNHCCKLRKQGLHVGLHGNAALDSSPKEYCLLAEIFRQARNTSPHLIKQTTCHFARKGVVCLALR